MEEKIKKEIYNMAARAFPDLECNESGEPGTCLCTITGRKIVIENAAQYSPEEDIILLGWVTANISLYIYSHKYFDKTPLVREFLSKPVLVVENQEVMCTVTGSQITDGVYSDSDVFSITVKYPVIK